MRYDVEIFLAVEEIRQLLMDITTPIKTGVDDERFFTDVTSQGLLEHRPHAGVIHRPHMDITYLSPGQRIRLLPAHLYPPEIQQLIFIAGGNGFYGLFPPRMSKRII